jgi:hypothetical protein
VSESILSVLFSITAFLYAIVGFGGGSTCKSLLVMGGFDFHYIPIISLTYITLPLAVVIGGQFGSFFGSGIIGERVVSRMTGCLVLFVGTRILFRTLI